MLKGFEVHFCKFWYIDGWVIVTYPMRPICKIECILENLAKKSTQFAPNWVIFAEKWYRDGSQNHAFRGIEMVEIFKLYFEHPRTNFFWRIPRGAHVFISGYHARVQKHRKKGVFSRRGTYCAGHVKGVKKKKKSKNQGKRVCFFLG